MHEATAKLNDDQHERFRDNVFETVEVREQLTPLEILSRQVRRLVDATARQRAVAFVKTIREIGK
jgi:hypothetical protein